MLMPVPVLVLLLMLSCAVAPAAAHGSMVVPRPRNAVDRDISPWNASILPTDYDGSVAQPFCPVSADNGVHGALAPSNGQACFWFSNGCTHGCQHCDGVHANGGTRPGGTSMCGNYSSIATICDPRLRAIHRSARCGASDDFLYYNPWRSPGRAPTFDACGMAGGEPVAGAEPPQGAKYTPTRHAKQGDAGSTTLPAAPTNTVWTAGGEAEVSWTMRANHGGGYSYRICPRGAPLTEACFQRTPLNFVGLSSLRWDGPTTGKRVWFNATTVAGEYTYPPNSQWRRNPIPVIDEDDVGGKIATVGFPAVCEEIRAPGATRSDCVGSGKPSEQTCLCSGAYGPNNLEIVDTVAVPDVPAGEWVLGWRYDTESTDQVWSNCADITIVV